MNLSDSMRGLCRKYRIEEWSGIAQYLSNAGQGRATPVSAEYYLTNSETNMGMLDVYAPSISSSRWRYAAASFMAARSDAILRRAADRYVSAARETGLDSMLRGEKGHDTAAACVTRIARDISNHSPVGKNRLLDMTHSMKLPDLVDYAARAFAAYLKGQVRKSTDTSSGDGDADGSENDVSVLGDRADGTGENTDGIFVGDASELNISLEHLSKAIKHGYPFFQMAADAVSKVPSLSIRIETEVVDDEDGDDVILRQLDVRHLNKMAQDGYAALSVRDKSYFPVMLENRDLHRRQRVASKDKKMAEMIVLDTSGSMETNGSGVRALGYAYNRLDAVIDGKLIVAFVAFATEVSKMLLDDGSWIIDTPDKARLAKSEIADQYCQARDRYSTNIPLAVTTSIEYMNEFMQQVNIDSKPAITIVTDDDDSSVRIAVEQCPYVINCLATETNPGMESVCAKTGGQYIKMDAIQL